MFQYCKHIRKSEQIKKIERKLLLQKLPTHLTGNPRAKMKKNPE